MDRPSFITAARTAFDLASSPEARGRWEQESACAGMTVGGLAHHLLSQAINTVKLLDDPAVDTQPIALIEHYGRAAWVSGGLDDEANVAIRERSDEVAASGPDQVLAGASDALDRLSLLLDRPRTPDTVFIPWQGWALTTDDFLVTRAMEMIVHSDDLAASIGLPTPEFPAGLVDEVLALLAAVAVRRHGQTALVRALSRPQRAAGHVSAF